MGVALKSKERKREKGKKEGRERKKERRKKEGKERKRKETGILRKGFNTQKISGRKGIPRGHRFHTTLL